MLKLLILLLILSLASGFKSFPKLEGKTFDDVTCEKQLNLFRDGLSARDEWALDLFDTWGKFQSGILTGNRYNLGRFTECLNFRQALQTVDNEIIQGQYCLVGVTPMQTSTITIDDRNNIFDWREIGELLRNQSLALIHGICLPATCSPNNVASFANEFLSQADLVTFEQLVICQTNDPQNLEIIDIIAIIVFSFFAILVIISTMYDVIARQKSIDPNELFIAFSAYTNGKQLFDVTKSNSTNSIECLLGMRSLSLLWIIFGHRFSNQQIFPMTNQAAVQQHFNHIYSVVFSSHNIAVDTFFLMGALLVTIKTLNALDKNRLNVPRMIFHRYIRYTPVLAALVLYIVSLSRFTTHGPMNIDILIDLCTKYWWSALLHVQNYVNPNEQCASYSWYLSVDFQLFILSPFLIYPAWKYGWKYLWSLLALALMSSVYILIMCLVFDLRVNISSTEQGEIYGKFIYNHTQARLGPWMIGIVLGYVLQTTKNKSFRISRRLNSMLWITSLSLLATVVVIIQPLRVPSNETSLVANAFYHAFHRFVWAVGIFWMIFACLKLKTGGIIRWFLSLPQWQPIARMSLSMYLVHPVYQLTAMAYQKDPVTFEIWPMLHNYWGDVLVTIFLGTILYLSFEAPVLLVENYFLNRNNRKVINISKQTFELANR